MVSRLWNGNNEDAVGNTFRLLATVCHDWWSLIRQPSYQRFLRSAFRSNGTTAFCYTTTSSSTTISTTAEYCPGASTPLKHGLFFKPVGGLA